MQNRINLMKWIIGLLVLLNGATLATVLYYRINRKKTVGEISVTVGNNRINGRFLRTELGFTDKQIDEFRTYNRAFRPLAVRLTGKIDSVRNRMFIEMQKEQPDTGSLNSMSDRIGVYHGQLKRETYKFYLGIRKACTPEQRGKLQTIFAPLFDMNENMTGPPQYGRRGRYGKDNN